MNKDRFSRVRKAVCHLANGTKLISLASGLNQSIQISLAAKIIPMSKIYYKPCEDYLIPDLNLPEQPLSKYGKMREKYMKENRKGLWSVMLLNGTLPAHLQEIDETANRRLNQMMSELTAKAGIAEELKERDP